MENWLECNGQAISASAYPELATIMGSTVPDLRGRVLQERDTSHAVGQKIEAGLPNITGDAHIDYAWFRGSAYAHGSFGAGNSLVSNITTAGNDVRRTCYWIDFNASRSNPVYGASETVQPPAYAVRYLIRARP